MIFQIWRNDPRWSAHHRHCACHGEALCEDGSEAKQSRPDNVSSRWRSHTKSVASGSVLWLLGKRFDQDFGVSPGLDVLLFSRLRQVIHHTFLKVPFLREVIECPG